MYSKISSVTSADLQLPCEQERKLSLRNIRHCIQMCMMQVEVNTMPLYNVLAQCLSCRENSI